MVTSRITVSTAFVGSQFVVSRAALVVVAVDCGPPASSAAVLCPRCEGSSHTHVVMAMASSQTPGGSARAAAHHVSSTTGNRGAESPSTSPVAATPPAVSRVDHAATHATGTPVVGTELLRRFEVISRLGSGTYGHVYKLRRRSNGQICVLKQVPMAGLSAKDVKDTFNEVLLFFLAVHARNNACISGTGSGLVSNECCLPPVFSRHKS